MLCYVLLAVVTLSAVMADDSTSYYFNYKMPKISADIVSKMKDKLKHRIVEVAKDMEEECKYVRAMGQYGFAIEMALLVGNGACSVEKDITQLETYKDTYRTSIIECFDKMDSTATYEKLVDELVAEIQTIDKTAKSEADACSGDEECEKKAYAKSYNSITSLYASKMGALQVAEDQAMTQALSNLMKCMIPKVSDSLKEMYGAIETLQSCIADGAETRVKGSFKHKRN